VDIALDAQLALIPGGERYPAFEVFYLKPVLNINGQEKILVIFLGHRFTQIFTDNYAKWITDNGLLFYEKIS
jgi:hypothetical protein